MGHLHLPFVAAEAYKPETTGVDFSFAFSHDLTGSDLPYNIGAKWVIAYGYDIIDKFGVFAELYGEFPEGDTAAHYWDAGLTNLLKCNIQLDTFIGSGLNNEQKLLFGAGISFRIPR